MIILTQYFYPEIAATAQLHTDLAVGLQERGWRVRVFTGQPAYGRKDRQPRYEVYQGVRIRRFLNPGIPRSSTIGRLINAAIVAGFMLFYLAPLRNPGIVLVDSTTPFLPLVAWVLRTLRGWQYVFLVEDVYPDIAIRFGYIRKGSILAKIWTFLNFLVYGSATRVIAIGPNMRENLLGKIPGDDCQSKVIVIHNWCDGEYIHPRPNSDNWFRDKHGLTNDTVVLYSGNMGATHDLESVVKAADKLRDINGIKFVMIGDGAKRREIEDMMVNLNLTNLLLLPYQPRETLPYSITCGDISIVTLEPGMEGLSVPSKLYSSLAAGQAVIAVMGEGSEVGDVIRENECGLRVSPGDSYRLAKIIQHLHDNPDILEQMKHRSRNTFEKHFTRTKAILSYEKVLSDAVK